MSSNNYNSNDKDKKRGKGMPANPKKFMDDDVPETTRRVGGRGAAPAMVAPSMGAMPVNLNLTGNPMSMQRSGFGASINTAPMKAAQAGVQSQNRSTFRWELESAPVLAEFHPLERTAVFVPNASASVVAQRVSDILRDRSIEATYDNDKAKAKCVTMDGVNFRVRLYCGRGNYGHGIIVEVQRRFGTSVQFHSDTQAILEAAEGKTPMPPPPNRSMSIPLVSDDEDYYAPPPSGASSLTLVRKMLSIAGYDAQYLGLQTLSSLVDADKIGHATARAVSVELLKRSSDVGEKVFNYVRMRNMSDETLIDLRVMALGIISNAVKASGAAPEYLREAIRPCLLQDLKEAETHPRTALMAAKCMEGYIQGDHDSTELNDAFQTALEVGQARHKSLMQQAQRCISLIR